MCLNQSFIWSRVFTWNPDKNSANSSSQFEIFIHNWSRTYWEIENDENYSRSVCKQLIDVNLHNKKYLQRQKIILERPWALFSFNSHLTTNLLSGFTSFLFHIWDIITWTRLIDFYFKLLCRQLIVIWFQNFSII